MNLTNDTILHYLSDCKNHKRLSEKTIKAYRIDLTQFLAYCSAHKSHSEQLKPYIEHLHQAYKPNTVRRKIASLHAFFHELYLQEEISQNPMDKLQITFRQEKVLPKTISLDALEPFYQSLYASRQEAKTTYEQFCAIRDIAVFELLLGTGLRISELCHLQVNDINFREQIIHIMGKGRKERILQIGNKTLYQALLTYKEKRDHIPCTKPYFFLNKFHSRLSEQSVRCRLTAIIQRCSLSEHVTPHMFRHTFATLLLEEDVDIRYIQQILGHSSITTTQIYTHIRSTKQAEILNTKNPRNFIKI